LDALNVPSGNGVMADIGSSRDNNPYRGVAASQNARMNKALALEAASDFTRAGAATDIDPATGRVIPRTYDAVLKKANAVWARRLTGDRHLIAYEEALYQSNPGFWNLMDVASGRQPAGSRFGKSLGFNQNLGREYFGPTFQGDQTLADLAKAMATENIGSGYGDDTPLRLQNLDATMTSVLFEAQHLVKWNWFERVPSIQPLYEWVDRLAYGDDRGSAAFMEGGSPAGGTAQFSRNQIYVRWFGVRRGITHQMALTGQLGGAMVDPVKEENRDGALQLLSRIEKNFVWGDHNIPDNSGNTVNYDGLVLALENGTQYVDGNTQNQMPNYYTGGQNVIDLMGAPPDFQIFEGIGRILAERAFLVDFRNVRAFMSPSVLEDLAKIKFVEEYKPLLQEPYRGFYSGAPLTGHQTNFGFIPFTYDIFLKRAGFTDQPPLAAGQQSPATPTVALQAGAPTGGTVSDFVGTNGAGASDAGTYYYWVTAANDSGESVASASQSVVVSVGQVVTATITPGSSNGQPVTKYFIYRGTVNNPYDSATGCIAIVAANGSNAVTYTDTNSWRPQQGMILVLERTPSNLAIAQMLPMLKWPLAIQSTTVEWLVLLYHALVVKAPQRLFLVKNIGRLNTAGLPGGVGNVL